jgi:dipeptidyl aminopeptidase/acylaminoacyl peptidase
MKQANTAPAAGKRPLRLADLVTLGVLADPDPAPDGRVVCALRQVDAGRDTYRSHLWLLEGESARRLTNGGRADEGPRWSPCGRRIAFAGKDGKTHGIWILDLAGGEPWPLATWRDRHPSALAWSPDGRRLAFLAVPFEPPADPGGPPPRDGAPLVRRITRPRYRFDGAGWLPAERAHLLVMEVPDHPPASPLAVPPPLTRGHDHDGRPAWSPDGRWIAYSAIAAESADEADWSANRRLLFALPPGGGEPRRLSLGAGGFDLPVWSPDGRWIAAVGTRHEEDSWGTYAPRLFLFPAAGGEGECLTEDLDRPVDDASIGDQRELASAEPLFASRGDEILFPLSDRGAVGLWKVRVRDGRRDGAPVAVAAGARVLSAARLAGDWLAGLVEDVTHPPEVFRAVYRPCAGGLEAFVTSRFHEEWLSAVSLVSPMEFETKASDGYPVHGWCLPPHPASGPGSPPPALLEIHGGPHAQYAWCFFFEMQLLAARGFAILFINPRGSQGYGDAHAAAVREHFAETPERDLLAAVDHAVAMGWADPERLGVLGGSGGGYLTSWLVGSTHRFRAACSQRSLNDWRSFFLGSDMGWHSSWQTGTLPWEDRERLQDLSPLLRAPNVSTPLLVVHNEEDHRCPIEQGEQLFAWLRYQGKPVEFLRFPGESHGLSRGGTPSRRLERLRAIVEWFERHLLAGQAAPVP